ncbi:uncharacterized protein [Palaemon carinicauda]|uniref:uncharacterized protein n=1 Tax=Palaemon carinicauda TaxID=392227 RepID=UPI0035B62F3C
MDSLAKKRSSYKSSKTTKSGLPEDEIRSSPSQEISSALGEGVDPPEDNVPVGGVSSFSSSVDVARSVSPATTVTAECSNAFISCLEKVQAIWEAKFSKVSEDISSLVNCFNALNVPVLPSSSAPALGTPVAEASGHREVIPSPKQGRSQVQFAITPDGCMSNLDEETPSLLRSPHRQRGSTPTPSQAPLSSDPGRSRFRSPNCRRGSSPAPSQDHEPSDPVKSSPRSNRRKYSPRSSSRSRRHTSHQSNSSMSPEGRSTSRPYLRDLSRHSSSRTPGLSSLRSLRDSSVSSDRRSRSQSSRRSNRSWSHHSPDHLSPYSRNVDRIPICDITKLLEDEHRETFAIECRNRYAVLETSREEDQAIDEE